MNILLEAARFRRIRAKITRLCPWATTDALLMWLLLLAASTLNASIRARVDDIGLPIHASEVELSPFGIQTGKAFQSHLLPLAPATFGWILVAIHLSWFVLPWLPAAWLTVKREALSSFFLPIIVLYAVSLVCFALFPLQPPWMAEPGVERVIATTLGTNGHDANQLAALPSMHVALPAVIALWFMHRRWHKTALLLATYTAIVAFEVVASGEHYVTDVAAAVLAAGAAFFIVERGPAVLTDLGRVYRGRWITAERGQNLIEFALMFPMVLLFLGAIIVFGLTLHSRSNLQQAVREGARQAAVGKSLTDVQNLAAGNSNSTLDPADVQWCHPIDSDGSQGKVGDPVRVYIFRDGAEGYPYDLVPSGGTFDAVLGADALTVRMSPVATARLEKTMSSPVNCP